MVLTGLQGPYNLIFLTLKLCYMCSALPIFAGCNKSQISRAFDLTMFFYFHTYSFALYKLCQMTLQNDLLPCSSRFFSPLLPAVASILLSSI